MIGMMWIAWLLVIHVAILCSSDSDVGGESMPADDPARDLNMPAATMCSSNREDGSQDEEGAAPMLVMREKIHRRWIAPLRVTGAS